MESPLGPLQRPRGSAVAGVGHRAGVLGDLRLPARRSGATPRTPSPTPLRVASCCSSWPVERPQLTKSALWSILTSHTHSLYVLTERVSYQKGTFDVTLVLTASFIITQYP